VFGSRDAAVFAAELLRSHRDLSPRVELLERADRRRPAFRTSVPPAFRDQAGEALAGGHTLLVLTVDEVDAFTVRDLLEQETRSLATLSLPPHPVAGSPR